MGSLQADEFGEAVTDGQLSLEAALTWHLESNHFPSMGYLHEAALGAIQALNDGDPDREVPMPMGLLYRGRFPYAPASALVEALHLDSFLEDQS